MGKINFKIKRIKKVMKIIMVFMLMLNSILYSQNFGFRTGLTTATLTGNNDAYDFDFIDSFSPGYKLGILGFFELSDVITLKPEFSYRLYAFKQIINNLYNTTQAYRSIAVDVNFDIKMPNSLSIIFGMGLDYLLFKKNIVFSNEIKEIYTQSISGNIGDQNLDPFANIGLCYKIGRSVLIDLEYRHLLDNWGLGNLNYVNELINSNNRSVKLHMLNFSVAFLI